MSVKIRTFSKRAYTWFSEDITIIGDLFHSLFIHIRENGSFYRVIIRVRGLYLNTLTISLSPPTSLLHLFNRPVSEKPHFSMTLPDAGLPVK